jgi:hypothetical protein
MLDTREGEATPKSYIEPPSPFSSANSAPSEAIFAIWSASIPAPPASDQK